MIEVLITRVDGTYSVPVERVEWKGAKYRAPRSVTVELISTSKGLHRPVQVDEGDALVFLWKERELFRGTVLARELRSDGKMTVTAHDQLYYLVKGTDSYTFKAAKASDILRRICADYKLTVGEIADTDYIKPSQLNDNDTLYDIVLMALDTTYKQLGTRYTIRSRAGKIELLRNRDNTQKWVIEYGATLLDYTYSTSAEDAATRIKLVSGDDSKSIVIVANDVEMQKRIGILQLLESVSEELNKAQLQQRARQMLAEQSKIKRSFNVSSIGIADVVSGTGVHVIVPELGIKRGYYVDEDQHTFEGNDHTMSLTLTETDELPEIDADQPSTSSEASQKEEDSKSGAENLRENIQEW